jgi:hypothetical protein
LDFAVELFDTKCDFAETVDCQAIAAGASGRHRLLYIVYCRDHRW